MGDALYSLSSVLAATNCKSRFLGLLPWDYYLNLNPDCSIKNFVFLGGNSSLLLILLAIVDDLLRIAGLLAVGFVIYAGVQFIMSNGAPDNAAKARTTAINALIGLAITMVAVSFVSFLGGQFTGLTPSPGKLGLDLSSLPNPTGADSGGLIATVLTIIFTVMGALAFMIIVIAGFRYVLSQGDPQATSTAKNTIIYALVGLVIAIAAQSIVSLAVSRS